MRKNGPAGLRDCKFSAARTEKHTGREYFEKADKITQRYVISVGTDLLDATVHLDHTAFNSAEKRRDKADKSVTDTMTGVHYKEM